MNPTASPKGANFAGTTIWTADNLDIMRGINADCIDLVYLDPPFNSKANYAAPIGSHSAKAAFKDTWGLDDINLAWHGEIKSENPGLYDLLNATRSIHGNSMMAYLIYMAIRVMEIRRILKPAGSVYLHCDQHAGHYLKLLMDAIFGSENCRNEIIWQRDVPGKGGKRVSRQWPRVHDSIFLYGKSANWVFQQAYAELSDRQKTPYRYKEAKTGRMYKAVQLGRHSQASIRKLAAEGRIHTSSTGKQYRKYYLDEAKSTIGNMWTDIPGFGVRTASKERTHYPTQKPLALLRRIIQASSNPGDMVFDPFCGCATTCIAAQDLNRLWAGIDISPKAAELVKRRMANELGLFSDITNLRQPPARTDLGRLPPYNSPRNKRFLYGEQGGFCNGCEEHFQERHFSIDHIIPRSKGGTDHISNLQLLCGNCNSIKGNRPQEYLLACLTDKGWIKRKRAGA